MLIELIDEIDIANANYLVYELERAEKNETTNLARRMVEMVDGKKCSICGMEQELHGEKSNHEFSYAVEMTREERLFAKYFSEEKTLVSSMDDGSLKAHIEELQDIAKEARARLIASSQEAQERSAKKKRDKGFQTSIASDDFTSEAINNVRKRGEKLTKIEREIERMVGMGISREDAENMYRAVTINKVQKEGGAAVVEENKKLDIQSVVNSIMAGPNPPEVKELRNPFAAKEEKPKEVKQYPEPTEESLKRGEDLNDIRLSEVLMDVAVKQEEQPKKVLTNPFAKKG